MNTSTGCIQIRPDRSVGRELLEQSKAPGAAIMARSLGALGASDVSVLFASKKLSVCYTFRSNASLFEPEHLHALL